MKSVHEGVIADAGDNLIPTGGVSAEEVKHECEDELQHKMSRLETKVASLESERIHLLGLIAEVGDNRRTTVSVGTDTECREHSTSHAPASIMSLSTGSEGSALEDEKFVKIKSCEMETSSSKSSSQSDKENFELEEQTQHYIEEIESLKKALQERDEAFKIIKLELEAALLEKSVETQSISTVSSEVKSIKQSLIAKDEELDEIVLVLDDVLDQIKSYIPSDPDQIVSFDSLESKLNLVKEIPNIFKILECEMKRTQTTLDGVTTDFQELQDQQNEVIGGYQLVSENYEKLQMEFDEFKESTFSSTSDQVNEEHQRFREELISKDEDLEEIQTRCDDLQQRLTAVESENEDLLKKVHEFESVKAEEVVEKIDKSVETGVDITYPHELLEENVCLPPNSLHLLSRSCTEETQGLAPIKKLQQTCLEQLRVSEANRELRESSLKKKLNELMAENSDLSFRLSCQENEMKEKDLAMEQLLLSVQEYRETIERKTEEINTTINSKQKEIEVLMSTYNTYYEAKEKLVSDLTSDIQQRDMTIRSLEAHQGTESEKQSLEKYRLGLELQDLKGHLGEISYTYQTQLQQLKQELESVQEREKYLTAFTNSLQRQLKENQTQIGDLIQQKSEADLALDRFSEVAEMQQIELRRIQGEHIRALTLLQVKESKTEEEFFRNKKEVEMLRESESLTFQQHIDVLNQKLKYYKTESVKTSEVVTKLKAEIQNYQKEVAAVQVEKESLQLEFNVQKDELKQKDALILELEGESAEIKEEILQLRNAFEEVNSRSIALAEELLQKTTPIVQHMVSSSAPPSEDYRESVNIIQLQEEIRILNESNIVRDKKIELLQGKISEIERSEIKAFEESFMLKGWVRQLELDNLRYQDELKLVSNDESGDNPKVRKLQDETMRLIYALDDRDKRCVQLTLEITRLLEERDGLQLKLSNVLKHNVELTAERRFEGQVPEEGPIYDKADLKNKLAQLEDTNFQINIDLRREREARKLVQEQLLFSQTSRTYRMRERNQNPSFTLSSSHTKSSSSSGSISSFDSGHASPDEHMGRSNVGNSERYNAQVV